MTTRSILFRYYERGAQWGLTCYNTEQLSHAHTYPASTNPRPRWLQVIVDAGKIGGHGEAVIHPPPDFVLWFRINEDHSLHSFGASDDGYEV